MIGVRDFEILASMKLMKIGSCFVGGIKWYAIDVEIEESLFFKGKLIMVGWRIQHGCLAQLNVFRVYFFRSC